MTMDSQLNVCVALHLCKHAGTFTCVGQIRTSGVFFSCSSPYCLDGLSLNQQLPVLATQPTLRIHLSPCPIVEVTGTHSHAWLLVWILGIRTQVLWLAWQVLFLNPPSHPPSPPTSHLLTGISLMTTIKLVCHT